MVVSKVLVTGASKGIGKALALALRDAGYKVVGTSRRPEALAEKPRGVEFLRLDLQDEKSIKDCVDASGPVDILINNAGGSHIWPAAEAPVEKIKELFQLNFFGPIELIKGFLPEMIRRRSGWILNIGSLAGKFAIPFQSAYSASKFALAGFSWSLRNEVGKYGIKVVVLDPGHIRTTIEPDVYFPADTVFRDEMATLIRSREGKIIEGKNPSVVAKKALKILKKNNPRPFYSVGGAAPLLVFLKRFFSDTFIEKQIKKSFGL